MSLLKHFPSSSRAAVFGDYCVADRPTRAQQKTHGDGIIDYPLLDSEHKITC